MDTVLILCDDTRTQIREAGFRKTKADETPKDDGEKRERPTERLYRGWSYIRPQLSGADPLRTDHLNSNLAPGPIRDATAAEWQIVKEAANIGSGWVLAPTGFTTSSGSGNSSCSYSQS